MADNKPPQRKQNFQVVIAVLGVIAVLSFLSRLPSVPAAEVKSLETQFRFAAQKLPRVPIPEGVVYPVNKTAAHMQFYFYQVGESAALGDLDGDGLPNDLCLTDVRAKTAMVQPVPGTESRYTPFALNFGNLFDQVREWPSVCRVADMNEDGLADLFIAFYGRPPLLLLRRNSGGLKPGSSLSMDSFAVS